MDTTYVKTNDVASLKSALSRLIDYANYLAENDRDRKNYIKDILREEDIEYEVVKDPMLAKTS